MGVLLGVSQQSHIAHIGLNQGFESSNVEYVIAPFPCYILYLAVLITLCYGLPMKEVKSKKNKKIKKHLNGGKLSELLKQLPECFEGKESVQLEDLRNELSGRVYGAFMLILALPNLIPMPTPGLSAIVAIPLILFTAQLVIGLKTPWLPKIISKRSMKLSKMKSMCNKVIPYAKKLENFIRPRLEWLVKPPADRLIALICLLLSIVMIMPIPFGNAIPALAICLFAIAILQRDGLFVILGLIISVISASIVAVSFNVAIAFIDSIIDKIT